MPAATLLERGSVQTPPRTLLLSSSEENGHESAMLSKRKTSIYERPESLVLCDKFLLRKETRVKSEYEKAMKSILLQSPYLAYYEPVIFRIVNSDLYPPDFIAIMNGRAVMFETHTEFSQAYGQRLDAVRQNFGDQLYTILILSAGKDTAPRIMHRGLRGKPDEKLKFVDEVWHMPKIYEHCPGSEASREFMENKPPSSDEIWVNAVTENLYRLNERKQIMRNSFRKARRKIAARELVADSEEFIRMQRPA